MRPPTVFFHVTAHSPRSGRVPEKVSKGDTFIGSSCWTLSLYPTGGIEGLKTGQPSTQFECGTDSMLSVMAHFFTCIYFNCA